VRRPRALSRALSRAVLGAAAAVLLRLAASPPPVAAPTSPPLPPLPIGGAGQGASLMGAAFPGDACASPGLPAPGRLPALLGPHPAARVLSDGVRRVVVARGPGAGAGTRLVIVGPVVRAVPRRGGDVSVAGEARVTYHGDVAHLCGEGAAYVGNGTGAFGPGTQGLHLDMEVDEVTLLARADIWTASAAYRVVGRLTPVPIPVVGDRPVLVQRP